MNDLQLRLGDCLVTLKTLPDNSVDSIVTDPPYGLTTNKKGGTGAASVNLENPYGRARIGTGNGPGGFMGHKWDSDVPSVEIWAECLRVLKPGGHLLAFAGTRTQHRMACRIEDAGFEIRDMIAWVYGSGFPKSLDVSKAIDKAAGAEREVVGSRIKAGIGGSQTFAQDAWTQANRGPIELDITAPAPEAARQRQGWGTALKPALEPITVARKPLIGTVAATVLEHGTGALNIDGCRIEGEHTYTPRLTANANLNDDGWDKIGKRADDVTSPGRWPANLIHDGSEDGTAPLGDAARFFYCAKASRSDRNEGLPSSDAPAVSTNATMREREDANWRSRNGNFHPTVKPTDLMRYLCRLVTPPGGVVLDPFMGSGSTGKAAVLEGFRFIGCELSPEYMAIANARIKFRRYLERRKA
jgi:site-specific DNA-methyltransferase (adenine-specific)